MIAALAAAVALILAAGAALGLVARRLPTLRLQLAALAVGAVVLPLAAVMAPGLVMIPAADRLILLAVGLAAAAVALAVAVAVARGIGAPLARLRASATALAGGDLEARARVERPAELAELAAGFNEMAERLGELFDARRQLVAWASHDLRTPLAALRAMIEAVEDGLVPPERYLPLMREQVAALGDLVDDLFELARLDAGALSLELREAPLSALVESSLRGAEAEARARGVRLEARVPPALPPARCAPEAVRRVLDNLVRNAVRHTPSDGAVAVVVDGDGRELRVAVEDTGVGLGEETARRMFDHFWRGDPARGADGGAGLGLAIARGLVEAHGGRIWAEDRPGGGARVCFTLPAAA